MTPSVTMYYGDAWELAPTLEPGSIDCIVTSPPYWSLRDYGHNGQFGLEATPQEYVAKLIDLFRLLRPALKDEGTVWLNLGDSYAAKDLVGIPWRVAFALQDDGWYLRSEIIWAKPNPMPESVTDRPTKAHEYVFLLSKQARYYFDQEAVREALTEPDRLEIGRTVRPCDTKGGGQGNGLMTQNPAGRNLRTVWTIATQPYAGAHFAVFPEALAERCVKAGCPEGGTVLDPFAGSGTTLYVARKLGRNSVGFELNEDYKPLIDDRLKQGVLL